MTDKIKIVTYCHRQKEIASSDSIDQMPLYIAQELDGECEDANSRYTSFLWHIILHSSDIDILILDNLNGFLNRLGKWYRWLNPMGMLVTSPRRFLFCQLDRKELSTMDKSGFTSPNWLHPIS